MGLLNTALRLGQPGVYQVQAAIAGCHAIARTWDATDWGLIVSLYDQLIELSESPVAALNRGIALRERDGPEVALAAIDTLAAPLDSYHLFHATRAEFLRGLGRDAEAAEADRRAAALTANPAELQLLGERITKDEALADLGS